MEPIIISPTTIAIVFFSAGMTTAFLLEMVIYLIGMWRDIEKEHN